MSILNYSAFCFCLWIYSKTRKKSGCQTIQGTCPAYKVQYPNFRTIIPVVSAFLSQFPTIAPSSTLPARRVWRSTNNDEEDGVNAARSLYEHFFYWTDRTKIYSPHLMNVGEQHFFSPPNFYQRNLCLPIGTHNFKLSFFYWHSLIFLEMANCDQTD